MPSTSTHAVSHIQDVQLATAGPNVEQSSFAAQLKRPLITTTAPVVIVTRPSSLASWITIVLPPQRCKPLLLGVCIDICTDDKSDDVEKWHPRLFRKEFLRECEGNWRCDPADLHDGHETSFNSCTNLMESSRSSDDRHWSQVNCVLQGRNLRRKRVSWLLYRMCTAVCHIQSSCWQGSEESWPSSLSAHGTFSAGERSRRALMARWWMRRRWPS